MTVHLIKLCVGADSMADLAAWIERRGAAGRRAGARAEHVHTTRMTPRRVDELLDGGSLYWVIRGVVECRQKLIDVRPVVDAEGVSRCELVMTPELTAVEPRPRGPFQGWRYLVPDDAPPDLSDGDGAASDMPLAMRRDLADLGLL